MSTVTGCALEPSHFVLALRLARVTRLETAQSDSVDDAALRDALATTGIDAQVKPLHLQRLAKVAADLLKEYSVDLDGFPGNLSPMTPKKQPRMSGQKIMHFSHESFLVSYRRSRKFWRSMQ